ncbi:unnamed protein product [Linum tenue]|uniref:Uncharacterized protein n=1 Tax=Linum tenue TaxID=586396 RepID=A0AAV0MHT9_9ROSI|nr:unnamed protein product [Linum tenue]
MCQRVRKLMRDQGVEKEPACSLVEAENKFHVFLVDDTAHPEVNAVYSYLKQLGFEMRISGGKTMEQLMFMTLIVQPAGIHFHESAKLIYTLAFLFFLIAYLILRLPEVHFMSSLFAGCAHSFLCVALATAVLGTWTPGLEGDFTRVG